MKTIIACVVVFLVGWVVWPYYAAYSLADAVREGDARQVAASVDWDSVRAGLRDDLRTVLAENRETGGNGQQDVLGQVVAGLIGSPVLDGLVDTLVNPQTVAMLIRRQATRGDDEAAGTAATGAADGEGDTGAGDGGGGEIDFSAIHYAFFTGPLTFEVDVAPDPQRPPLALVFGFQGTWKLTRIELPIDELRQLVADARG